MLTTHRSLITIAGSLLLASAAQAALVTPATQLVNGSFETPALGTSNYAYPNGRVGGWTYKGGSALVDGSGSSDFYGATAPAGARGRQFAALQRTSTIDQTFYAYATQRIEVSWLAAGRPLSADGAAGGNQSYSLSLLDISTKNNVSDMFSTTTNTPFAFYKTFFSVTAGDTYDLVFRGMASTDQTAFIDNVAIYAPPVTPAFHQPRFNAQLFRVAGGAVPEPAAWTTMIAGFALLGYAQRRRTVRAVTA